MTSNKKIEGFRKEVWDHYRSNGRSDLPWRKTNDPYKILVSEVMLQQTQVPRVIEKYRSFLKKFPTVRILARSHLAHVLKEWDGLGYNRRGKYLHDAARELAARHRTFPKDVATLRELPGMGPYTASAVRVFAFDLPDILIETNVRTAYFHHFFPGKRSIRDVDLIPLATQAADGQDPREWHWALMDYGSYLKRSGVRNNGQSKHYAKQPKFEGSLRQVRGAILRSLHEKKQPKSDARTKAALAGLVRDGLIKKANGKWRIA